MTRMIPTLRAVARGALVGLACFFLSSPIARAQDDDDPHGPSAMRTENLSDERARSHYRVGEALYREGRFEDAGREFESAFELSARPALLFNAYLAYRDAGNLARAVDTLSRYLASATEDPEAPALQRRLDALRITLAEQQEREAQGAAEREQLEAERARLAAEAEAAAARALEIEERDDSSSRGRAVVVLAAGGGMVVLSGLTALMTKLKVNDVNDRCPGNACDPNFDFDGARDQALRRARATDVLFFGGLGVAGVGLIWWLVTGGDDAPEEEPPPATADLGCTRDGCAVDLRVRF